MKNYLTNEFFGVPNGGAFLGAMQQVIDQVPGAGVWASDNIFTFGRNLSFLDDTVLMESFERNAETITEKAILWRTAVLTWAARHAMKLDGDFVECACYRGTTAKILIDAVSFKDSNKRYFLYDSFEADPRQPHLSSSEFEIQVRNRFLHEPNVIVTAGRVPEALETASPQKVALLHLDINNADAEAGALEILFNRMVPSGIVVLDDYGWVQYRAQKIAADQFFGKLGYEVLEIPTGQGIVIR